MRLLHRLRGAVLAVVRRQHIEQELDDELRQFFEASVEQKRAAGMSAADAERAARVELGSPAAVKDWVRDAGWESHVESVWQDTRYAIRILGRSPGFAVAAIGTLAVGLGTTAAMYAVVDAVLLKPFAFASPDRVVEVRLRDTANSTYPVGAGSITALRRLPAVEFAAGTIGSEHTIVAGDLSLLASGEAASEEFFQVFGVQAAQGRTFSPADRDAGPVVVLSDGFWRRVFGGRTDVVGQSLLMNGVTHRILGVMPPDFRFRPALPPDYWVLRPFQPSELANPGPGRFQAFCRLRTSNLAVARAQLPGLNLPPARADDGEVLTLALIPMLEAVAQFYGRILWSLLGAVGFVLLLACGNVANILLARARQRGPELLVRAAIGASRGRLLRQVLTEYVVIAGTAAIIACALAWLFVQALPLLPLTTTNVARIDEVALNGRVYAFLFALTLGTVPIFGALPALAASRRNVATGPGRSQTRRHGRTSQALIAVETALTIALLAGTGLVALRISNLLNADFGFEHRGLHVASFRPIGDDYRGEQLTRLYSSVIERLRERSGIQAALIDRMPLDFWFAPGVRLTKDDGGAALPARIRVMSPGALPLIGAAIRGGRDFSAADRHGSPAVAVVNESLAARLASETPSPIGTTVTLVQGDRRHRLTVIGVTEDLRDSVYRPAGPEIFVSAAQFPPTRAAFVLRSDRSPEELTRLMREALRDIDPRQALADVVAIDDRVQTFTALSRFVGVLLSVFAALAVLLASTGVLAVAAGAVASRTREIGIRVAIGATSRNVLGSLSRDFLPGVIVGALIGLAAAASLTSVLRWLTPGVESFHPLAYGGAIVIVLLTVGLGAWLPARRALAIEPTVALSSPEEW